MSKVLFRQHRGSLSDSMKTVQQVKSKKDIKRIIPYEVKDINIVYYAYDDRVGWSTYIVTAELSNNERGVIGFTNGKL